MKSKGNNHTHNLICLDSAAGPVMVPYRLERSPRLRRMHLQIDSAQGVILKMPLRQSATRGVAFLKEHGDWICQTLATQPRLPRLREYLQRYPRLSLEGRWYRLEWLFQQGACQFLIDDRNEKVRLTLDSRRSLEDQMSTLLRNIAKDHVPRRLKFHASRIGVKVHGITVRDQKCRWGSCSETGGISLNWRLILLPPKLHDHVLLHELAHLKHFDHSRAFHEYLRGLDPHAKKHARQLDEKGSSIISLGQVES